MTKKTGNQDAPGEISGLLSPTLEFVDRDGARINLFAERIFAHSPEGLTDGGTILVLSDPNLGILAAEMCLKPDGELDGEQAASLAGEIERRWNLYPLFVEALHDMQQIMLSQAAGAPEAMKLLKRIQMEEGDR